MHFEPDNVYHIFNQGNRQQDIFSTEEDYLYFLKLIRKIIIPNSDLISYCLMPNHFHMILHCDHRVEVSQKQGGLVLDCLTNSFRKLLSNYAQYFNKKYGYSGSLFRQKTKSKCLTDSMLVKTLLLSINDYCFNCFNYVHRNPITAHIVENLANWKFSSYLDYAGLRNGTLVNKELATKFCSYDLKDFVEVTNAPLTEEILNSLI